MHFPSVLPLDILPTMKLFRGAIVFLLFLQESYSRLSHDDAGQEKLHRALVLEEPAEMAWLCAKQNQKADIVVSDPSECNKDDHVAAYKINQDTTTDSPGVSFEVETVQVKKTSRLNSGGNIVLATCAEGYTLLGGGVQTMAAGDDRNGASNGGSCRVMASRPADDAEPHELNFDTANSWFGQVFCLKTPTYDAFMWTYAQCGRLVHQ